MKKTDLSNPASFKSKGFSAASSMAENTLLNRCEGTLIFGSNPWIKISNVKNIMIFLFEVND